jgi:hypothetical protein
MLPLLIAVRLALPALLATDTIQSVVWIQANRAGQQSVVTEPDGTIRVWYEYNDRGRGPKTESRFRVGGRGELVEASITGVDYFKQPIAERLSVTGGVISWTSPADSGKTKASGNTFYFPLQAPPEATVLLARALLEAPGHRLAILPAGEASITEVERRTVNVEGRSLDLVHYAITGLDFLPDDLWLDTQGRFFASLSGWQRVIRAGWESTADHLAAAQDSAAARRSAALAERLRDRPRGPVAITHVTLFDAPEARLVPNTTVIVEGNRITRVGPAGTVTPPAGARIIEGRGKTLLPGLWDMHAHIGDADGPLDIAAGITSVRDMANDIDYLLATRKKYDEGAAIGPRIVMAGFMDGPGRYAGPTKVLVSTADEGIRWVEKYHSLGYEQIKLYSSLDPALVRPIAARAHALGMRVSGHIPNGMVAARAVQDGYDEIQHTNMLFLNFMGDTIDTRTPARFIAVGKYGPDLDLASDSVKAFLGLLKQHGTVVDPTLATFEEMFMARPGALTGGAARMVPRLPALLQRQNVGGGLTADPATSQRYRTAYAKMLAMVKTLYDHGIPIVAGTDCTAGFCLHRELELYSQAGIPNPEILKIATWGAATVMKRTDRLGAVRPGFLADLILVAGNPVANISDIRKVDLVIKDGVILDPAAVYRSIGVRPWNAAAASGATGTGAARR